MVCISKHRLAGADDQPDYRVPEVQSHVRALYYICQNVERMMEMYSAELKILDRNTVQYMVD